MGADGVEVAQQHHAPFRVRVGDAAKDLLGHVLGPAVGVGAAAGAGGFPQGHLVVGGVDRGGGGEDQVLHPGLLHHLGQHQGGVQVVVVVFPGLGHGFAHGLQTGKVDDAADLVFGEDLPQQPFVPDIALIKLQGLAGELLHPLQAFGIGIAQIVDDHHAVAALQKLQAGVRADIPGAAGDQNIHDVTSKQNFDFCPYFTPVSGKNQYERAQNSRKPVAVVCNIKKWNVLVGFTQQIVI